MKCEVIRDLLPLYLDDVVHNVTKQEIEEHLMLCKECQNQCEHLKKDFPKIDTEEAYKINQEQSKNEAALFKMIRKKSLKISAVICICITLGLWIMISFIVYPSANPVLKPYFFIEAKYVLSEELPTVLFGNEIAYIKELIGEEDLRILEMNASFDKEGNLESDSYISMEFCEDKMGLVKNYICVFNLDNNKVFVHKSYQIKTKEEGVSFDDWFEAGTETLISSHDFGDSDMVDIHVRNNSVILQGWYSDDNPDMDEKIFTGNEFEYVLEFE